ncbi:MAG: YdcF family protein [Candidatus Acidiferrales bacterium]
MTKFSSRSCVQMNAERGGIIFRLLFLIFFLAMLGVLWLVREPILRLAGGFLIVDDSPRSSDVIVVLDDDYDGDGAARAAELFKAGWGPRVVATGEYLRPYASEAELMQKDLVERGVPATSIVRLPYRAVEMHEEAEALGTFASSHGWKKILVVTANYRTRRMRYILERSLASGTELHVVAARDPNYDPNDWWRHRAGVKNFLRETVGFFAAIWEMRHKDEQTS